MQHLNGNTSSLNNDFLDVILKTLFKTQHNKVTTMCPIKFLPRSLFGNLQSNWAKLFGAHSIFIF